jgi:hypothetical protein
MAGRRAVRLWRLVVRQKPGALHDGPPFCAGPTFSQERWNAPGIQLLASSPGRTER